MTRRKPRPALVAVHAPLCLSCGGLLLYPDLGEHSAVCGVCRREVAHDMAEMEAERDDAAAELADLVRILCPLLPALPLACTCTRAMRLACNRQWCDRCTLERIIGLPEPSERPGAGATAAETYP